MHLDERPRFDKLLQFRAPGQLYDAADEAAGRRFMSLSHYIRAALIERLERDGAIETTCREGAV